MYLSHIFGIVAVIVIVITLYALFIEPYRIRISRIDIPVHDLPEGLDGLTICQLSDTHLSRYGRLEKQLGRIIADIDMDICALTGDLVNSPAGYDALRRVLSHISPRLGIFAVTGNGDYRIESDLGGIEARWAAMGINSLVNTHMSLCVNGADLTIIGVGDPFLGEDDLGAAVTGVPAESVKILLAHSPDIVASPETADVDLILAGHTHGGQIRLPFLPPLWLHCRYPFRISNGYYGPKQLSGITGRDMSGVHMYVSRGVASTLLRVRFHCPPEVVVLTLWRRFHGELERGKEV